MFIILTTKLPVKPSPPKLSIFYAVPWPMFYEDQHLRYPDMDKEPDEVTDTYPVLDSGEHGLFRDDFGYEPDWSKALKIRYKAQDIRVWRHECNILPDDRLQDYLTTSHEIVAQNGGSDVLVNLLADSQSELRLIFDAAILDGSNYAEALLTCLGMHVDSPHDSFIDIFWWRCRREYASIWCYDEDLEE